MTRLPSFVIASLLLAAAPPAAADHGSEDCLLGVEVQNPYGDDICYEFVYDPCDTDVDATCGHSNDDGYHVCAAYVQNEILAAECFIGCLLRACDQGRD